MSNTPKTALPPRTQHAVDLNQMHVLNGANIAPVYANNAAVLQMPHDFRLVFTEVLSDGPGGAPRVEMRASVGLAPTMLKALHAAIGTTIATFEKAQGDIAWPPKQSTTK